MVDGSNESLYRADEELHPLVRTFSLSQTIFTNLDVRTDNGVRQAEGEPVVNLDVPVVQSDQDLHPVGPQSEDVPVVFVDVGSGAGSGRALLARRARSVGVQRPDRAVGRVPGSGFRQVRSLSILKVGC